MEEIAGKGCHIDHRGTFGCPAYVLIPKEESNKLASRVCKGGFVGYTDEQENIRLVWHPEEKKAFRVRYVRFDEIRPGLSDEDLRMFDDDYRDMPREEETVSR